MADARQGAQLRQRDLGGGLQSVRAGRRHTILLAQQDRDRRADRLQALRVEQLHGGRGDGEHGPHARVGVVVVRVVGE